MTSISRMPTLLDSLWSPGTHGHVRRFALPLAASLILVLSAKVSVPFWPVPLTLQTLAVFMLALSLGWRMATESVLLYLAYGVLGFSVFAGTPEKGIGLAYMMGPTGGYLFGFLLASAACGWLAEHGWDRSWQRTAASMVIGNLLIYGPGLLWLGTVIGWDKPVLQFGLYPFLPGAILKMALVTLVMPMIWRSSIVRGDDSA